MGRLIDEDLLIKELKGCTCTDKHDERIIKDFCVHAVHKQPTAYDPEEVVELLEGASYFSEYLDAKTRYINLYKAIKIVREGGVK